MPDKIAELVDSMLNHDPLCRPQSAQEVAELLAPFCDATAPQSLVRAALNCSDDQDQQLNSQLNYSHLKRNVDGDNAGKTKSRWPRWIAAAFLPLAFFAGILITVTTDKGTLVIESDEPGVTVKVTQGDRVVDTLRVEKQPSVLRLYSGKYIVELTGVEGDGLEISDSKVALNRGEKQIVRIQQRKIAADTDAANPDALLSESDENRFQGKPLAYWMNMLGREKDVATIAQAMQAVSTLAENDEDRLDAARQCMQVARRLGGIILTGRPSGMNGSPDASGWFMTELNEIYPTFFPEPGLQVIIEELQHGTERSAQACFLFLSSYSFEFGNQGMSNDIAFSLREHYAEMAKSDAGRAQLRKLDSLLEKIILRARNLNSGVKASDMSNIAIGNRYLAESGTTLRVEILQALGEDLSEHPHVVEWAKRTLKAAMDAIETGAGLGAMSARSSPLLPHYVPAIQRALANQDYNSLPIALALLEPRNATNQAELTEAFTKLARDKPQVVVTAIVKHLERAQPSLGFVFGIQDPSARLARLKIAKETLLSNPPESPIVIKALNHALLVKDSTCIFGKEDIEELLRHFSGN